MAQVTARRGRPDEGAATPEKPRSFVRQVGGWSRELLIVVLGALIISSVLRAFVGQMFIIPSGSMEQTLQINDRVVAIKLAEVKRGQIVVFSDPGNWLGPAPEQGPTRRVLQFLGVVPDTSTNHLIKRVIGMPGDTVECCDAQGRIMVNGVPLDETSYLYQDNGQQVAPSTVEFKVVVPAGRVFVMGDHRNDSQDSRCHLADPGIDGQVQGMGAFVPLDYIVGPATAILMPLPRAQRLRIPETFAAIPAPTESPPSEPVIEPAGVTC